MNKKYLALNDLQWSIWDKTKLYILMCSLSIQETLSLPKLCLVLNLFATLLTIKADAK